MQPSKEEIYQHLTQDSAPRRRSCRCSSARRSPDHGVRRLWKALRHETPAPRETAARLGIAAEGEPLAQVIKTYHPPHTGKLSLVAGVARRRSTKAMTLNGVRVAGVLRLTGAQHEKVAVGRARRGRRRWRAWRRSPPARCWPRRARPTALPRPERPQPVFGLAIAAEKRGDDVKLIRRHRQADRGRPDPRARAERRHAGDGAVGPGRHPSADRDRPAAQPPQPRGRSARPAAVPYKETIKRGAAAAFALQAAERRPRPVRRHRRSRSRPLPRGSGLTFIDSVVGGAIPRNYIPAVEEGVEESLKPGPLGFPVVDVVGHPDHRPVPCGRQLGHGVQDRRAPGDAGSDAEMRAGPAGADRCGRDLGAQRLHRAGAAPGLGPARPDPRLRRQGGLAGLGRGRAPTCRRASCTI